MENALMVGVGGETLMSIKSIAMVLEKDESTIRKIGKSLFPDEFCNGIRTYLNEAQVTTIKMNLGKNSELPKTSLEKELIIQQALMFQAEKIKVLSIKAQVADKIADTTGLLLPSSVGKLISGEPNKFCQWLVDNKIMFRKGSNNILMPYSQYDKKYFEIKVSTYKDKSTFQSYFTPRGVLWVQAKFLKKNNFLQLDYSENI